jgi:hypothetical protein
MLESRRLEGARAQHPFSAARREAIAYGMQASRPLRVGARLCVATILVTSVKAVDGEIRHEWVELPNAADGWNAEDP